MKPIVKASLVALLASSCLNACKPSTQAPPASPDVDVAALEAALAKDPKRLRQTLRRCQTEREVVGEVTCAAAQRVQRKQFMGSGKTKYTPGGGSTPSKDE